MTPRLHRPPASGYVASPAFTCAAPWRRPGVCAAALRTDAGSCPQGGAVTRSRHRGPTDLRGRCLGSGHGAGAGGTAGCRPGPACMRHARSEATPTWQEECMFPMHAERASATGGAWRLRRRTSPGASLPGRAHRLDVYGSTEQQRCLDIGGKGAASVATRGAKLFRRRWVHSSGSSPRQHRHLSGGVITHGSWAWRAAMELPDNPIRHPSYGPPGPQPAPPCPMLDRP